VLKFVLKSKYKIAVTTTGKHANSELSRGYEKRFNLQLLTKNFFTLLLSVSKFNQSNSKLLVFQHCNCCPICSEKKTKIKRFTFVSKCSVMLVV